MSTWTITPQGQVNLTGDTRALYLDVFGGEILKTFLVETKLRGLTREKPFTGAKTASFPLIGTVVAKRHTPGVELVGDQIRLGEREVHLDDPLLADVSVADVDEILAHFDVRSDYAMKLAHALAKKDDQLRYRTIIKACRTSTSPITGGGVGAYDEDANFATDADTLLAGIAGAAQTLDEKNVPETERITVLKPAQYYLLTEDGRCFHRDFGNEVNGSQALGKVAVWSNVRIIKSNNVPTDDQDSAATGEKNDYTGDLSVTVAPVFHRAVIGTLQARNVMLETERSVSRQATLMVAKIMNGHGVLQPECGVELRTGTPDD
jgi:hypothetical protein